MAAELIGVGVAVAQMLLRANELGNAADIAGHAFDAHARLLEHQKSASKPAAAMGKYIARRLEKRLNIPDLKDDERTDLRAAAADIAMLFNRLSRQNQAVLAAARNPNYFDKYAAKNGGNALRRWTPEKSTPFFDELLTAAAEEFAALAPESPRFIQAALNEILDNLPLLQSINENSQRTVEGVEKILNHLSPDSTTNIETAISTLGEASESSRKDVQPDILPPIKRTNLLEASLGPLDSVIFPAVILGEGGIGKSVLAGQMYDTFCSTRPTMLLLCSRIPASAKLQSADTLDLIFGKLASKMDVPLTALLSAFDQRPLIIIDTLDLLLREETVDDISSVLQNIHTHADLIVTCREREWRDLVEPTWRKAKSAYTIPYLNRDESLSWAEQFTQSTNLASEKANKFLESLMRALDRRRGVDVLGVPLRLAMACDLYAEAGAMPDDLTVTQLYSQYWDQRVYRNRRGRLTDDAERKQETALLIASKVWDDSADRFVEDVAKPNSAHAAPLRELLSEGVVKEGGPRVSFFHQTFSEFAVAKYLAWKGANSDWVRFSEGLKAGRSGYWGVAGHLVMQQMNFTRLCVIMDAIPRHTPEGVRLLLRGIFSHSEENDNDVLEYGCQTINELRDDYPSLLASAADVLGEATEPFAECATEAIIKLLAKADEHVTALVRAMGRLIPSMHASVATTCLISSLELLSSRANKKLSVMATEVQRLITYVFDSGTCHERIDLLQASLKIYGRIPSSGQAELIRVVSRVTDNALLDSALIDEALNQPLPAGAVEEALHVVEREWSRVWAREARGWADWREFLMIPLPKRWDSVQVRLIGSLSRNSNLVTDLIGEVIRPTEIEVASRDRLVNAAKYVADQERESVINCILNRGIAPLREAVGPASQIIRHVEPALSNDQRAVVISLLKERADLDTRKAWPAIIKLSVSADHLLGEQIGTLTQKVREEPPPKQPGWDVVTGAVIDALVQAALPHQLLPHMDQINTLIEACVGLEANKEAKFRGALTPVSSEARDWVDCEVIDGHRLRAKGAVVRQVVDSVSQWDADDWRTIGVPWFVGLLRVENEGAVPALAKQLLVDASRDYWTRNYTETVLHRLISSLQKVEDPQVAENLLSLLAELTHHGAHPGSRPTVEDVEALLSAYHVALHETGPRAENNRAAIFTQYIEVYTDVAKAVLPFSSLIFRVRDILVNIDSGVIAERSSRVVAGLLVSIVRTYPQSWSDFEEQWAVAPDANKRAIIECALQGAVPNGASVALRLARRDDCPAELASSVFRRVGH